MHEAHPEDDAAAEAFRTFIETNRVPSTSLIAQGAMAMLREGMTAEEVAGSLEFFAGYLRTDCFAQILTSCAGSAGGCGLTAAEETLPMVAWPSGTR